jgi:hypothetical protein
MYNMLLLMSLKITHYSNTPQRPPAIANICEISLIKKIYIIAVPRAQKKKTNALQAGPPR